MNIRILYTIVTFCCLIYSPIHAKNYSINVIGNNYIDQQIVISLFVNLPEDIANIDENQLLKELYDTGYFEDIEISLSAQASAVIDSDLYFARQPTNHHPRPNRRER